MSCNAHISPGEEPPKDVKKDEGIYLILHSILVLNLYNTRSPDILPAAGSISQASEFSLCNEQLSKESTPPRQLRPRHTTDPQKHPKSLPTAEETCIKLKEDKRLLRIEPHRVLCKVCNTWIKLKSDTSYGAQIWTAHIAKCESKRRYESYGLKL